MTIESLKIKDFLRSGQKEVLLDEAYTYDDLPLTQDTHAKVTIKLNSTGLLVHGRFETEAEEPCDRCTQPHRRKLSDQFEERFVHTALLEDIGGGEHELHDEDFYDTIGPDGVLDVKDLIHQYLVIALSTDRVCNQSNCRIL